MKRFLTFIILTTLILFGVVGYGQTLNYYFSPIGNDANDGLSVNSPKKDIQGFLLNATNLSYNLLNIYPSVGTYQLTNAPLYIPKNVEIFGYFPPWYNTLEGFPLDYDVEIDDIDSTIFIAAPSNRVVEFTGTNSTFRGVVMGGNTDGNGGGVYSVENKNNSFCGVAISNSATGEGGGVFGVNYCQGYIAHNTAGGYGGGVKRCNVVQDSIIKHNNAVAGAGGVGLTSAGQINQSVVANNTSGAFGGGVDWGLMEKCVVVSNSCSMQGGGTYHTTVRRSFIGYNQSKPYDIGNGFYGGPYGGSIFDSVVAYNRGTNSAVYVSYTNKIINCTVVNNESGISLQKDFYADNNIFFNNGSYFVVNLDSTNCFYGANNFTNDPVFVLNADYPTTFFPATNSPVVDAGYNGSVKSKLDFFDRPRTNNGTVDIGAVELYTNNLIYKYFFSPNGNDAHSGETASNPKKDVQGFLLNITNTLNYRYLNIYSSEGVYQLTNAPLYIPSYTRFYGKYPNWIEFRNGFLVDKDIECTESNATIFIAAPSNRVIEFKGSNSLFEGVATGGNVAGRGGGVYSSTKKANTFRGYAISNSATDGGGGIYGVDYVYGYIAYNNALSLGGGAYDNAYIFDSIVKHNTTTSVGGGIRGKLNTIISSCYIANNYCDSYGGGIDGGEGDSTYMYDSVVVSNEAAGNGGGSYRVNADRSIYMYNRAGVSAFYQWSGYIKNSILAFNYASNYTLHVNGAFTNVNNTIVNNTGLVGIRMAGNYYVDNLIFFNNQGDNVFGTNGTYFIGSNIFTNNPEFVVGAEFPYNFYPSVASPVIDSGENTNVFSTVDLLGKARIYNGTVDIGAIEYNPASYSNIVYKTRGKKKALLKYFMESN